MKIICLNMKKAEHFSKVATLPYRPWANMYGESPAYVISNTLLLGIKNPKT